MTRALFTIANGQTIDLLAPDFDASDFPALAEQLAKVKRFCGATPGAEYSVAEHSCLGADWLLTRGARGVAAAPYFLLHDIHKALLGEDTAPKEQAIALVLGVLDDMAFVEAMTAIRNIQARLSCALHVAAGLRWPSPFPIASLVGAASRTMMATECRDLAPGMNLPKARGAEFLPDGITGGRAWPWRVARDAWMRRARQLLPALRDHKEDHS